MIPTCKAEILGSLLNGVTAQPLLQVRVAKQLMHLLQADTAHQGHRSITEHFTTAHSEGCLGGEQRLTHGAQRDRCRARLEGKANQLLHEITVMCLQHRLQQCLTLLRERLVNCTSRRSAGKIDARQHPANEQQQHQQRNLEWAIEERMAVLLCSMRSAMCDTPKSCVQVSTRRRSTSTAPMRLPPGDVRINVSVI